MIEEEFKQILNQDMVGTLGPINLVEEEQEEVEDQEEQEEMEEYADEIHSPVRSFGYIVG